MSIIKRTFLVVNILLVVGGILFAPPLGLYILAITMFNLLMIGLFCMVR